MHFGIALIVIVTALPAGAAAECYQWPLRDTGAYDGDTLYITMPGLPDELARMTVRLRGVDTPERSWRADCEEELEAGTRATFT